MDGSSLTNYTWRRGNDSNADARGHHGRVRQLRGPGEVEEGEPAQGAAWPRDKNVIFTTPPGAFCGESPMIYTGMGGGGGGMKMTAPPSARPADRGSAGVGERAVRVEVQRGQRGLPTVRNL